MRYFLEVAYNGFNYSGLQKQNNATTIQGILENALIIIYKETIQLTCSSRTDAQVNAFQNFFHFDAEEHINPQKIYNLNAILPSDIYVINIAQVANNAHSRFDATSRYYMYQIHTKKDPFLYKKSYFFPSNINITLLNEAAQIFLTNTNFQSYSKKNTQVHTFLCTIVKSEWIQKEHQLTYHVEANRFLRGMVKALVGTSLSYATQKITKQQLLQTFTVFNNSITNFTPPGYALYLSNVNFPKEIFL